MSDKVLQWFRSFLTGRLQENMTLSQGYLVLHLGFKSFVIDTNDISTILQSEHKPLADDTKIYRVVKNIIDARML